MDNLLSNRLIEMSTKALRRVPSSGETLPAPRQQLRRPRVSAFELIPGFQGHTGSTQHAPEQVAWRSSVWLAARSHFNTEEIFIGA